MLLVTVCLFVLHLTVEGNIQGEHCVDVSTYDPVVWHNGTECCKQGVGTPKCVFTPDRVTIEHNETICRVEIHEKTTMGSRTINTTMRVFEEQMFQPWDIDMVPHEIVHIKYNFTCENKTRQNCITNWVTNPDGTKVSVPGPCEDVYWLDCYREPYNATFTTMKHVKKPLDKLRYQTCREMIVPNEQMFFIVEKVPVSVCEVKKRNETVRVQIKTCEPQLGPKNCTDTGNIPWQKRIHKEKCLQPGPDRGARSGGQRDQGHHGDHGDHGDHADHGHHGDHGDHDTSGNKETSRFPNQTRGRRNKQSNLREKLKELGREKENEVSTGLHPRYLIQEGLNNPTKKNEK